MGTILLFEDDYEFAEKTKSDFEKEFKTSIKIELSKNILSQSKKDETFVQRLYDDIKKVKSLELIVADVNLYGTHFYSGLSAEIVGEVGRRLFIPVCIYARKILQISRELRSQLMLLYNLKTTLILSKC